MAIWRAVPSLAAVFLAGASIAACSHLHLTQDSARVINRTGEYDDYEKRTDARPVAARVLPYALLAILFGRPAH